MTAPLPQSLAPFDALYAASDDPWAADTRWYEERKRDLVLAVLPRRRYGRVYEAGCGNGHLSARLAARCDALIAADGSAIAVATARRRLERATNAFVAQHRLPEEWPDGPFDAIVVAELVYFLDGDGIDAVGRAAARALRHDGDLVACDWKHPIEGYGHRGDEAHRRFARATGLPASFEYEDDDFVLTGWSASRVSVAMREGVR